MEPDSPFYKELEEVYSIVLDIQQNDEKDERQEIAKFPGLQSLCIHPQGTCHVCLKKSVQVRIGLG